MTRWIAVSLMLIVATTADAETLVLEIDWADPPAQRGVPTDQGLAITADDAGGPILRIDSPPLTQPVWALRGEVRYSGVDPAGYLELNNSFPGLGVFFSRGRAASGPMGQLQGDSDWRPFVLPFFAQPEGGGEAPKPDWLEFGVELPAGRVELRGLGLYEYAPGEDPLAAASGAWIDARRLNVLLGSAGASLGVLGALVGALAARGRARSFALGAMTLAAVAGLGFVVLGIVAWLGGQPPGVYYNLLLFGVIVSAVAGGLLPGLRKRYAQSELRRISAADSG